MPRPPLAGSTSTGPANVCGAGIGSLSGTLTIESTRVTGNRGDAEGVGGLAIGGGILNVDFGGGPPELILRESVVTANQLTASSGITPWVAASSAPISPARSRCRSR